MPAIREHALRLFREQGYDATTVEQIAAAAEVSPSTFFRYFPTKEDVVLQDDFDDRMFEAFDRQPPALAPIAALRAAMRETIATFTPAEWDRVPGRAPALGMSVPEVRARMMDEIVPDDRRMAGRAGASGPAGRRTTWPSACSAGAVIGAIMAVMLPGAPIQRARDAEAFGRIDGALAVLEPASPSCSPSARRRAHDACASARPCAPSPAPARGNVEGSCIVAAVGSPGTGYDSPGQPRGAHHASRHRREPPGPAPGHRAGGRRATARWSRSPRRRPASRARASRCGARSPA